MEPFHPLSHPVGAILRNAEAIGPNDSLARAAWVLRESSAGIVPVVEDGVLVGVITEQALGDSLERGIGSLSSASAISESGYPTIPSFASGAEALRRLADADHSVLVVVDGQNHYLGVLSASDLYPRYEIPPILPPVGGMATPFGVYLTSGGARAGAGHLALVATGSLMFLLLFVAGLIGGEAADWIGRSMGHKVPPEWLINGLSFALFAVGLRLIPLSGTHASEHKVVHALENGEPLELEVVRRMPRVHPRCGTNFAAGLTLFMSLTTWEWNKLLEIRLMAAIVATAFLWRPLGSFMQLFITTKPPSDRQLEAGIEVGRELIQSVHARRRTRLSVADRIVSSGMLHVTAGSMLTAGFLKLISVVFKLDLGL